MNQNDLTAYGKDTDMTSLVVSLCTDDTKTARAAFRASYDMVKNHVNKSGEEYSFVIGLSNTDGKDSNETVPYHLHGVIKGPDSHMLAQDIRKRVNRKAALKNEKAGIDKRAIPAKIMDITGHGEDDSGERFVGYILNQCSYTQQYSNATEENKFDFRKIAKSK